jgi:glycosyltransferase involved in cell wall biosynthesis
VLWYCNEPRRETYYDILEPDQAALWRKNVLTKYRFKLLGKLRLGWRVWWYRFLDKLAVRKCQAILANSCFSGRMIEKAFKIKPIVCHAGIRLAETVPPLICTKPYGLLVSRMVFHKNVNVVLSALAEIKKRGVPMMKLVLVGSGPDLERLKESARALQIDACTEFTGYVDDAKLESLYTNAEYFIYIPVNEPFGMTLIEAMMHGVPVIGAGDGGAVEIVAPEIDGLLVDPNDPHSVEVAVERLMADRPLRQRLGKQARIKVKTFYSLEKFVERFEQVCRHLCRDPERGKR